MNLVDFVKPFKQGNEFMLWNVNNGNKMYPSHFTYDLD